MPALTLLGFGALVAALVQSWGFFSLAALALVVVALGLWSAGLAAFRRSPGRQPMRLARALAWLGAVASAAWGLSHLPSPFFGWVEQPPGTVHLERVGPAADPRWILLVHGAALALLVSHVPRLLSTARRPGEAGQRWATARTVALFVLALLGSAWILRATPAPPIDVWEIRRQGAELLLAGHNPYGSAIHAVDTRSFGQVFHDYIYPPIDLVLGALGQGLGGDVRWASIVSILLGAGLLHRVARRRAGPGDPWPDLLAAMLLFHPRGLYVVEQAWSEPLALPLLGGLALLLDAGRRRGAGVVLGLLGFTKQYYLLFLPFGALSALLGVSGAVMAAAVGASTLLPFVAPDPTALFRGLVVHHLRNPLRPDALTLPALFDALGLAWPIWIGFAAPLALIAGLFLACRRRGAFLRPGEVFLAAALALTLFFVCGRQAFCNYYYLVGATALYATALAVEPPERRTAFAVSGGDQP